ncbi:o-succinylbenzoate--CoA ligase [Myceligenerans halotolerans]
MRDELKDVVAAIREALDGGTPYAPQPLLAAAPPPRGTALVVRTSGSTGAPREVALSASALRASATATHERLGGPGRWFLALPATHVAGLQVISRSVVAGTRVGGGVDGPFTPDRFAAAAGKFLSDDDGSRTYVSLVPTQAHRLVEAADDGAPAGLDTLARFDAVLLGGATTPLPLRARLRDAGVRAVATYGMSETCGGCVYDGVPLAGVRVRLARDESAVDPGTPANPERAPGDSRAPHGSSPGIVEISGPVIASGYLETGAAAGAADDVAATAAAAPAPAPAPVAVAPIAVAAATSDAFRTDPDGTHWFRTSDLGTLDTDGRLTILGRADDVIVTGGVNVAPAAVEAALADLGEVCVVGVPDPEWGRAVVAVLALGGGAATPRARPRPASDTSSPRLTEAPQALTDRARALATAAVGRAAAPRRLYLADTLPLRGPGKPDRAAIEATVAEATVRCP